MHLPGVHRAQGQMETRPHLATSAPRVLYVFVNTACAYLGMWWGPQGLMRRAVQKQLQVNIGSFECGGKLTIHEMVHVVY